MSYPEKYAFQTQTVADAVEFLRIGQVNSSRLYKSPTGSGKSYMICGIKGVMGDGCYVVCPSHEIVVGIYRKSSYHSLGFDALNEMLQRPLLEADGFWTVKRLYNELAAGRVKLPTSLIFDESHHSVDATHATLWALAGFCARVGFTATDYRGTPVETQKLRDAWPERRTALTLRDAVDTQVISRPDFSTWPLLDDHTIDVVNGEFVTKQVDAAVKDKLADLITRIEPFYDRTHYDRPTMVTFSSVQQCRDAVGLFRSSNLPTVVVVGTDDPLFERDRRRAFQRVVDREVLLIQIQVVGEGVDLPIRRLIDVSPTMSPMRWMQRVGRVTRPTDTPPEVINCCHNFTRHAYLWAGVVPAGVVLSNQQAWGDRFKPNRRDMARALGLEGFGRFMVNPVPLADGLTGSLYCLQTKDGLQQYAAFLHPMQPEPFFFEKRNELSGEQETFVKNGHEITYNKKTYGRWRRIESMPELSDCVSLKPDPCSPKQINWWQKCAHRFGLDATHTPTIREFQILPILSNTGVNVNV